MKTVVAEARVVQEIVARQEGYGPFVVMGMAAAMSPEQIRGATSTLRFIDDLLEHVPDEVIAKSVLKTMLNAIRMDLGRRADCATA